MRIFCNALFVFFLTCSCVGKSGFIYRCPSFLFFRMIIEQCEQNEANVASCTSIENHLDATPDNMQGAEIQQNAEKGVSTNSAHTNLEQPSAEAHWYALRTTYGREKKAYNYLLEQGVKAFYPTIKIVKEIKGKRKTMSVSRLPNMFFAYGTERELSTYVFDNTNLPFLRFYYRHYHEGRVVRKTPMIVPDDQMKTLRIICQAESSDTYVTPDCIHMFEHGQRVRVTGGAFAGAEGRVARFKRQQRVGVCIDGLLTMVTAYVPSSYLQPIDEA